MSTITVIKRSHRGDILFQYEGELVERGETWVCIRALFDLYDRDKGYVVFRRGDTFIEWHYTDRWYNVFEMHDVSDGHLKGWYCNIARPALIRDDVVEADDLALDVFVDPNGNLLVLDEDEFAALEITDAERLQALATVDVIRGLVQRRETPFEGIRGDAPNRVE